MIKPIIPKDLAGILIKLPDDQIVIDKINELVDAVNVLQAQVAILQEHAHPTAKTPEDKGYIKLDNDSLQKFLKAHPEYKNNGVIEIPKKEPADPYAEQRKWVGRLCRFWFADAEHPTFGILDFVDAGLHPEPFHINCGESEQGWYPHCEPVKPDDDIIYKGE
jgi:hypothetical protein